jgi:hypothetical protein
MRNLFAVIVLLLAMSPFTAPFQTCGGGQPLGVAVAPLDDAAGSTVAPLVPKALDLLIAPPAPVTWSYKHACTCTAFVRVGLPAKAGEHPPHGLHILRI